MPFIFRLHLYRAEGSTCPLLVDFHLISLTNSRSINSAFRDEKKAHFFLLFSLLLKPAYTIASCIRG